MGVDSKTYLALSVVMFLQFAVWGAWAPVLAARLLGPLKMSGKQTGWIYATLPIACIISPLVAGWLADQYVNSEWILIGAHLLGAVLLFLAAKQVQFKPLLIVMMLYSLCYAATLPLVNSVLFTATAGIAEDGLKLDTEGKVFIWAPVAWALIGWSLTGWRVTRKTQGDGSDCLYFAAGLSVLMALGCFLLPANPPRVTGEIPLLVAMQMLGDGNFLLFILVSLVVAGLTQFYFLGSAQFMQDRGVSSTHVPAAMALAQIAQAVATFFLLGLFISGLGFKWTLVIGGAFWFVMYAFYIVGKPTGLIILAQPLHGVAYVFFMIVGQIFAESVAPEAIRSSMQALIFAATTGVGLLIGTQFAGTIMDKYAIDGKFQWSMVWVVPCAITLAGIVVLAAMFQDPVAAEARADSAPPQRSPPTPSSGPTQTALEWCGTFRESMSPPIQKEKDCCDGVNAELLFSARGRHNMHAKIELPKAFSVRDDHEFLPVRHLLSRMNPNLLIREVATGVHVDGGGTVRWGIVYLNGEPPSKKKVETALREAGFDFVHNILTQAAFVWTDHTDGQ